MMEYAAVRFLLKHGLPILALVLLAAALGWAYHTGAENVREKAKAAQLQAQLREAGIALERAESAAQAARAAGERNDREIPKARAAAAERAGRASTADRDQRVRDVGATQADYAAAAGGLQGTRAR